MASVRDSMHVPWWASTYNRYNYRDPSNVHYGRFAQAATNTPLTIDSNPLYAVQLNRHCSGVCSYNVGAVDREVHLSGAGHKIWECSDSTGAPNLCGSVVLGRKRTDFAGSRQYDRMGQ